MIFCWLQKEMLQLISDTEIVTPRIFEEVFICANVDVYLAWKCTDLTYVKAKCRPTMRQTPSSYFHFIKLNATGTPVAGICKCPAGRTQSCVHIAALLIILSEIIR